MRQQDAAPNPAWEDYRDYLSSARLEAWLAAEQSSPREVASRSEQLRRLAVRVGRHLPQHGLRHRRHRLARRRPRRARARELAIVSGRVGGGKPELTSAEKTERQQGFDHALAVLRKAVAAGFKDADRMQKDKAFDPLRSNDAFRDLAREVEKQSAAPKKRSRRTGDNGRYSHGDQDILPALFAVVCPGRYAAR